MPYYSNTYTIKAFHLIGDKTLSDQDNRMIGQFVNCLRPKMIFWNEGSGPPQFNRMTFLEAQAFFSGLLRHSWTQLFILQIFWEILLQEPSVGVHFGGSLFGVPIGPWGIDLHFYLPYALYTGRKFNFILGLIVNLLIKKIAFIQHSIIPKFSNIIHISYMYDLDLCSLKSVFTTFTIFFFQLGLPNSKIT